MKHLHLQVVLQCTEPNEVTGSQFGFWGRKFKNLGLDSESAPPTYLVSQFSVKMGNFEFFGLNLGKLPNYV